jgi:hypothetical protein
MSRGVVIPRLSNSKAWSPQVTLRDPALDEKYMNIAPIRKEGGRMRDSGSGKQITQRHSRRT